MKVILCRFGIARAHRLYIHLFTLHNDRSRYPENRELVNTGGNLARFLCLASDSPFADQAIEPLFVARKTA